MKRLTEDQARLALSGSTLAGDETPRRVIANKIVLPRKDHICHNCRGTVARGDHSKAETFAFDGEGIETYRWCFDCCVAISKAYDSSDDPFIDRYEMFAKGTP